MIRMNYGAHERTMWARARGHVAGPTPGVVLDLPHSAPRHSWVPGDHFNGSICRKCRRPMAARAYRCIQLELA